MIKLGSEFYSILYRESVVKKDIPRLPKNVRDSIKKAIKERLQVDPINFGKPLRYNLKGFKRLRIGAYRIIYEVDKDNKSIQINAIRHRKDIYDDFLFGR